MLSLIGLTGLLGGCDQIEGIFDRFKLKQDAIIVERSPDRAYEHLFPYYVELCALSQWETKDGRRGNPFGHAVMYIKGACKDEAAPFPLLRRCRTVATEIDDPEHGAGVSVGRWFRNVNWVAVPGYELFYTGDLKPGERLTREHFDATVRAAIDKGVFDGVELHGSWTRNGEGSLPEFVAERSIGTDFALQFSRNVFCARNPVTEPVLDEIIAFLNDKNQEYATGKADYNWNLLADNCVHTVRNALAAANFWSPISVLQVKISSAVRSRGAGKRVREPRRPRQRRAHRRLSPSLRRGRPSRRALRFQMAADPARRSRQDTAGAPAQRRLRDRFSTVRGAITVTDG